MLFCLGPFHSTTKVDGTVEKDVRQVEKDVQQVEKDVRQVEKDV